MNTYSIQQSELNKRAAAIAEACEINEALNIYGVPRGGVPAAYLVARYLPGAHIVTDPREADVIVDDILDSGATLRRYDSLYPTTTFYALVDKRLPYDAGLGWVVFPWDVCGEKETSADDIVVRLLQRIGEDPTRGGLLETPKRFLGAWDEWTSGYGMEPADVLKCFEDGAEDVDEMVVVKDIPFYSNCEHHMAPFFGSVSIGYIPHGKIVGLSKFKRLVDVFARRLQVQERLTSQIARALQDNLEPRGVGVIVRARHMCKESRGINSLGQETITSKMLGVLREKPETRNELLQILNK